MGGGFRLIFFFIGDGGLSQFFFVGDGVEKYVPPDPPSHLILEQPLCLQLAVWIEKSIQKTAYSYYCLAKHSK